jgi:hypothetical protein
MDTLLRSEKTGKNTKLKSDAERHDAQIFAPNCNIHHNILMVFCRVNNSDSYHYFCLALQFAAQTYT